MKQKNKLKIATDILFVEKFDDFTFKGCTLLVLSSVDNNGAITILGLVIAGDIKDIEKCLIEVRKELFDKQMILNPVIFCEPDAEIGLQCFNSFIALEETCYKARLMFSLARIQAKAKTLFEQTEVNVQCVVNDFISTDLFIKAYL